MAHRLTLLIPVFLLLAAVVPVFGDQFYLYAPREVPPEAAKPGPREILVREVPVQKGDTLYGLARRHSGRGANYPQILLFNEIKNPDLIFAGSTLRLPVIAADRAETPSLRPHQKAAAPPVPVKAAGQEHPIAPAGPALATRGLYEQGVKAYRRNNCPAALELFDRFLAADPASPLAADAALYQAECYLKQSGQ